MDSKNCVVVSVRFRHYTPLPQKKLIPDNFCGYSTELFCIPKHYKDDVECVFLPCGLVQDRIERMAQDIVLHYQEKPFRALCVLKGGYRFFADMLDRVRHYYHFNQYSTPFSTDFIRVKSYINDKSRGEVTVMGLDSMEALKGQNILIVEDIIETGKTMAALVEYLKAFEPKEVKVSSLFVKRSPRSSGYKPDSCLHHQQPRQKEVCNSTILSPPDVFVDLLPPSEAYYLQ
nr:hypoxanthine-guanine phosphoribosyltransferase-like isoform X2 [Dermacentor andersoni]